MLGIVAVAGSGACGDVPTLADPEPGRVALSGGGGGGMGGGTVDAFCSAGQVTPGDESPYRYLRFVLKLPASTRSADGATAIYRYRGHAGGKVVAAVNCRIPDTPEAIAHMDRAFRVRERGGMHARSSGEEFSPLAVATLDPLVVNACQYGGEFPLCWPEPWAEPDPRSIAPPDALICYFECGDAYIGPDPEIDQTFRPECQRDEQGFCITRALKQWEWERFIARVAQIKETIPECAGAKQVLQDLIAAGREAQRIRFWDGIDYQPADPATGMPQQRYGQNLSDSQGRYIEYDSWLAWTDPFLIVHEGLHLYLHMNNIPVFGAENEAWTETMSRRCV